MVDLASINSIFPILNKLNDGLLIFHGKKLFFHNPAAEKLLKTVAIDANDFGPYTESLNELLNLEVEDYSKQLTGQVGKPVSAHLFRFQDFTVIELQESFETRLGEASHELRRPLTNVKTLVDTLYLWGAGEDPEARKKFLGQLHTEVQRLTRLVEELLNLSRMQAGVIPLNVQQIALRALIEDTFNLLQEQADAKNVKLVDELSANFVLVADIDKITHVVQNLIENAIRYNKEGGTVKIYAGKTPNTFIVQDTGSGIAEENIPYIFERFKRFHRDVPGTGLGLAIVKSIVDIHGGKIEVESVQGEGTKFIVSLPQKKLVLPTN
jgi:signal transduction histidine kinase